MLQELLDVIGFGLCHQLPERSLFGGSIRVPVCARDTGIYVGFAVAFLVLSLLHRDRPSRMPSLAVNVALGLGVVAMVVDGVTSYAGIRPTTNELRLLTGLLTGYAIAAWIVPIMSAEVWRAPGMGSLLPDVRSRAVYLVSLVTAYLAIWWIAPLLGLAFPLIVTASIILTFTVVNLVIVALLPPFSRAARGFRDLLPAIGVALLLTGVELIASSALKGWLFALPF